MKFTKQAELSATALAVIIVIILLFGVYAMIYLFNSDSLSVVGVTGCQLFTDADGKSYSSFNDMRSKNADLTGVTNEYLISKGLDQTAQGVFVCN